MAARVLHVSDLHAGAHESPDVGPRLSALVERLEPELIVVSGDLTHRGRREQHDRAAALLRGHGVAVVAVPGNHDIPYTFPARFTRPWAGFERVWGTTRPVHVSDGVCLVGINSVRPWRHQSGAVREDQLRWAAEQLEAAPPGALRMVALHHQLIGAPWRTRKRPVARRDRVLGALLDAGAELIVSGHTHQGAVAERHEFEVWSDGRRGATVATAPGLGQPRPHRRGEARGLLVYEADERSIAVHTYVWRRGDWGLTASRRLPRGAGALGLD
ncbi:MAG: metallophosphoesterase family protein [Verrucomicrobiota bacterium]